MSLEVAPAAADEVAALRAAVLGLCAPLALGDELVPGARLIDVTVGLGLGLVFAVDGERLIVEVSPGPGPAAARSAQLGFAYRGRDRALGQRLCAILAAQVGPREAGFLAELAALGAATAAAPRVRAVAVDRLLEPGGTAAVPFYTCSPYVGCLIGCRFCYAQSRLGEVRALLGRPPALWGTWVDVRVDAPAVLAAELRALPPAPIKFCPIVSDPYHAIEARTRLTRACLETIAAAPSPPPVLVLTRAPLILRDLDVLAGLPAWVGVSLPTIDDDVRAHFEPRAATVAERLAILAAARAAGLRTFAVVQPMLPGSIERLADALAAVAHSVSLDVLRGEESAGPLFDRPDVAAARTAAWQAAQRDALSAALDARGVPRWIDELPPDR
jgi:DNA repair photolyase